VTRKSLAELRPDFTPRWRGAIENDLAVIRATEAARPRPQAALRSSMSAYPWRYEPIDLTSHPLGEGPFHARGLAYATALKYVDTRLRGGRAAFLEALGPDDRYAPYYDQIFLVTGEYDVSPLVHLYVNAARMERVPVGRFIEERAKRSADTDSSGMWKPMLRAANADEMAGRLHLAFNRYFPPSHAEPVAEASGRFEGVLSRLPVCMSGLYVSSTIGFFAGALALKGARDVKTEFERPVSDSVTGGVPTEKARFCVTWRT
jgi:hypothetical protein